ncbi:DNA-binding Lrp family transcriptional regulator [Sphingomonas insulae]|uniref:MarR family transcriptional regulator n=1 Tax=Sphingomonas insulae TaxID=424800 RepID=A0ABN1HXZ2_9SPHN|nr:replication protein A [Sphingomonas insulae]NIJ29721.1 DNA-binding Lrp family transcriptional regulator [Sphingomonas insulae]
MSARSVHEVAGGKPLRQRTGQPVRRNSHNAGGAEMALWRQHNMFPKSEHNARMRDLEEFERETKLPGKRNGAIGGVGLQVYRYLLRLRGKKTGRLDPTVRWIADAIGRSRSAVHAALTRLKEHGYLDWIRRCQPIENAEPDEQQTEQIANAYILQTPATAKERVRRMLRRPTEFVRAVADKLARQRKLETSTVNDVIAEATDPGLRAVLERLRDAVEGANPPSGQTEAL